MLYLDNAATTKPSEKAVEAFLETVENFANPSSLHRLGLSSEKIINSAREEIAKKIGADAKNIYFTSGGTEANNMAILGYCRQNKKRSNHIITSKVEHPSVLDAFLELSKEGFIVSYVGVTDEGIVDLDELKSLLREDTLFVSIMSANNETGAIMPIEKISKLVKSVSKNAVFHTDAVQAFGKISLNVKKAGVDMMSISAHKIHGFKGTGALYSATDKIMPIMFGGGQQKGLRSGTENLPGIAAFKGATEQIEYKTEEMKKTRETFKKALMKKIENISFNGPDVEQTGYVLNVSFDKIKAEILLHMLEDKGIFISTGSACSSNKPSPSHVLMAMGCDKRRIEGAIRISFCDVLSDEEIEAATDIFENAVKEIRKYVR